jgi:outer membrane lipoprotein LolB
VTCRFALFGALQRLLLGLLLMAWLAACSTPGQRAVTADKVHPSEIGHPNTRFGDTEGTTPTWQGRLNVQVHSEPPQSNTASFTLQGDARLGELALFSPLGTTLARLQWRDGQVHLHRGQETERFASMDELTQQLTGSALPVAALFDWLQGQAHEVPGWQADLSAVAQGSLTAWRSQPLPTVTLRIKLDR